MPHKPRLIFYCQHLLGIGHLTRSLALCESLVEKFEVHFLQGGPDVGKTLISPDFHHHFLPPLLMREKDSSLYDPAGLETPEHILHARGIKIRDLLDSTKFDALITELFPFGRNKFKDEVLSLISLAKSANQKIHVSSSLRDILVEKKDSVAREQKMLRLVQDHYDNIFVHSDKSLLKLEETFSLAKEIADKIIYTGFVTESVKAQPAVPRRNEVLVSMGGGVVGEEMIRAVLKTLPLFPELLFRVAPGPYAPIGLRNDLEIASKNLPNLKIENFLKNFEEEMTQVRLSISLAGYNTMMNILNTKTPSLVYPYMENIEQNLRATKMSSKDLLHVFYQDDLQTEKLFALIEKQLSAVWPSFTVDLNGSKNTALFLSEIVQKRINL